MGVVYDSVAKAPLAGALVQLVAADTGARGSSRITAPDEIDVLVHPNEIAAMEVYPVRTAPPQFQPTLAGCRSVVIWTKLRPNSSNGASWKQRAARISAAVIAGVLIGLAPSPR